MLLRHYVLDSWIYLIAFDGVSIFFVLSGFLIGGIWLRLINQSEVSLKSIWQFWLRRWFRTLPNYYLILTILAILSVIFRDFRLSDALPYYGFVQNVNWVHPPFFAEAWSLSIEEWFYLLLPLLFLVFSYVSGKSRQYSMLFVIVFVILFSSVLRYLRANEMGDLDFILWDDYFRRQVFTRLDSIMYGVLGAYMAYYSPNIWRRHRKLSLVIGLILIIDYQWVATDNFLSNSTFGLYFQVFSFAQISIGTLLLMPFLSSWKGSGRPWQKVFVFISLTSYSLYLVNSFLVLGFIIPALKIESIWLQYLLFWVASVLIATLIYKYYEVPTTKLRDRFS